MVPIYEQLMEQIKSDIIQSELKEGEALPSVRTLAGELRISALTVKKAYDKLEEEGFVTTVHGKGTYVSASDKQLALEARQKAIEDDFDKVIDRALSMGMKKEQYCDFMEEYLNQGILEAQMEREQRERYIRLLRQKLKVKTTLSTCMRLFQNLMKTGDYVQAEEILGLMDQKWHRKEEFWILKIRYLAERKKGAELQQCLRQMKEEQIYLSSKSKEVLAFWLD